MLLDQQHALIHVIRYPRLNQASPAEIDNSGSFPISDVFPARTSRVNVQLDIVGPAFVRSEKSSAVRH
jgi:hypothetical protein